MLKVSAQGDVTARIRYLIQGDREENELPIGEFLRGFVNWMESDALTLKFEDLIGAHGGGDQETQLQLLSQIFDYIGLPQDDATIANLAENLVSTASPTYRKGTINQWRKQFDSETKQLFKQYAGAELQALGYGFEADW